MNSFGILRTNVGLTTNVKIVIDSKYNMSLNSIDSNYLLSSDRFKKYSFSKDSYYDEIIQKFFKDIPVDISYQIKYNNDIDIMGTDFSEQYDDLYNYGARNIIDNKNYQEEYEYFAPLYIKPNNLPSNFIIFRVDGSGLENINKDIFRNSILSKFKTIKVFNLKSETKLGQWLNLNFTNNPYFPHAPLEVDFKTLEFTKWCGIDYERGGYTSKSLFLGEYFESEKEFFELEKFIFDSYRNNKIVFPNILNISFLFDDVVSNPVIRKKWSLNRYYGFYLDAMKLESTMSPYNPPKLRNDVVILPGNLLYSPSSVVNPFEEEWSENKPFYVEYMGQYFIVKKYSEVRGEEIAQINEIDYIDEEYQNFIFFNYKIIADLNLEGLENDINRNYGYIDSENILRVDKDTYFSIDNFDDADVWLINIDGIYHNIIKIDNTYLRLNTDYSFNFKENYYEYQVASEIKTVSFMLDNSNEPKVFNIYKLKFTDIKDFDTRIVDTQYSKYEYEKADTLTQTEEPKMYFENALSNTEPKEVDDYLYNDEVVNIPVSSEYTANYETFKVEDNSLSDIWRINPVYCRWGFQGSLAFQDYPYLLNNSLLFEENNKCANPYESEPNRIDRNLDYFYTINSSTSSYLHHSLHIEKLNSNGDIDNNFYFDLNSYFNIGYDYDYFSFFFERPHYFDKMNIKENVKKYSYFNKGDGSIPNITLFKGLELKLYNVDSVTLNSVGQIENININNDNTFEDYKFSIILTENGNSIQWKILENWELDKQYLQGDIVFFDDILYIADTNSIISNPTTALSSSIFVKSAPYNSDDWISYDNDILWSPTKIYDDGKDPLTGQIIATPSIIFNDGVYYLCDSKNSTQDFWNPYRAMSRLNFTPYELGDVSIYKGRYYMSMTSSNPFTPGTESENINNTYKYWMPTNSTNPKWIKIEIWNSGKQYLSGFGNNSFVIHEDIVYRATIDGSEEYMDIGEEPGVSIRWKRIYSLEPDTDYVYTPSDNSVIFMNNRYYLVISNQNEETLDNGINIYINKKWKNVLVQIYFNDNTLPNISNNDRDDIYTDIHKVLSAYNFIRCINDISNRYEFVNLLTYKIIDENYDRESYSFIQNITSLPYIISCELPDGLLIKDDSLIKQPLNISINSPGISSEINFVPKISPNIKLIDGRIDKLSKINWYNNIPIAYTISDNIKVPKIFKNYNSIKNIEYLQIQRSSGYYMPIFYDIPLFNKDTENKETGNYIFDENLTDFGIMKERKIRKINRKESILKFKNSKNERSIYPMIDEFGYTYIDFMIFKSTWDLEYYIETVENKQRLIKPLPVLSKISTLVGQPLVIQSANNQKYNL
jgi:hypothetical protein